MYSVCSFFWGKPSQLPQFCDRVGMKTARPVVYRYYTAALSGRLKPTGTFSAVLFIYTDNSSSPGEANMIYKSTLVYFLKFVYHL